MRRPAAASSIACIFGGFLFLCAGSVLAETKVCDGAGAAGSGAGRITSVPFTISAPGVYCVTQKITSNLASGGAITINANNVVLDLNDFAIGNIGAGPTTTAIGINAVDRQNIHIRNGTLRGFDVAVQLANGTDVGLTTAMSSGHIVEGLIADTSYLVGLFVKGPYVTLKNNKVINTVGDSTLNNANGIIVGGGVGIHVVGNEIYGTDCTNGCTASTASVAGIIVSAVGTHGAVVENNIVTNATTSAVPLSDALFFNGHGGTAASLDSFVFGNTIDNWSLGYNFCNNPGFVCTGVLTNNIAGPNVTTPYSGGTSPLPTVGTNF